MSLTEFLLIVLCGLVGLLVWAVLKGRVALRGGAVAGAGGNPAVAQSAAPVRLKPEPKGIRGLMIFVAFGVWVTPLIALGTATAFYRETAAIPQASIRAFFYPMILALVGVAGWSMRLIMLMHKHSHRFPIEYQLIALSFYALMLIGVPLTGFLMASYHQVPPGKVVVPMMQELLSGSTFGGIFASIIWILYIRKSRRVKNTFVN